MKEQKTFSVEPTTQIVKTLSYSGYTLKSALADIIDNSIGAGATEVKINFNFNNQINIDNWSVQIIDNGHGMNSKELENAIKMGSCNMDDERSESDLGRYGMGMKTASFSQADYFRVISKRENERFTAKAIDKKMIEDTNSWLGIDYDDDNSFNVIEKHGTIVEWKKLRFIERNSNPESDMIEKIKEVVEYIGMIFNRFIRSNNVVIKVQDLPVEPWDPCCSEDLRTCIVSNEQIKYNNQLILVKAYILPSSKQLTQEEEQRQFRGDSLKYQGFYVYRNDRIIIPGGWLDINKLSRHSKFNCVRISVDIKSSFDSLFDVDFLKTKILFPQSINEKLKRIAETARNQAKDRIVKNGVKNANLNNGKDKLVWNVKESTNGLEYSINSEHPLIKEYTQKINQDGLDDLNKLLKLLAATVPKIMTDIKTNIVSNYSDKDIESQIIMIRKRKINNNINEFNFNPRKFDDELKNELVTMEPFNKHVEVVELYFERLEKEGVYECLEA